jgi:hypothetical protein
MTPEEEAVIFRHKDAEIAEMITELQTAALEVTDHPDMHYREYVQSFSRMRHADLLDVTDQIVERGVAWFSQDPQPPLDDTFSCNGRILDAADDLLCALQWRQDSIARGLRSTDLFPWEIH